MPHDEGGPFSPPEISFDGFFWSDSFPFNPRLGIDAQEVAKLDREIGQRRHYLQQRLSAGIPELEIIRERTIAARTTLQRQTLEAFEALMQAEADVTAS